MIQYFRMKRNEIKVKTMLYGIIVGALDSQKEALVSLQKIFTALKDVPAEELKTEFVKQLAEIVHEENRKNNS